MPVPFKKIAKRKLGLIFTPHHWKKFRSKLKIFWIQFRAIFLLISAGLGLFFSYMTLNMVMEPGLSTILARYHVSNCEIVYREPKTGRHNCPWSSCIEGCTRDILFRCWQVTVHAAKNLDKNTTNNTNRNISEVIYSWNSTENVKEVRLQVNTLGCGYESCDEWFQNLPAPGKTFICYVNKKGSIAVNHVNKVRAFTLIILGILPLIVGLGSTVAIYFLYCRKGAKDKTLNLETSQDQLKQKQDEAKLKLLIRMSEKQGSSMDLKLLIALTSGFKNKHGGNSGSEEDLNKAADNWVGKKYSPTILDRWKKAMVGMKEFKLFRDDRSFELIHTYDIIPVNDTSEHIETICHY